MALSLVGLLFVSFALSACLVPAVRQWAIRIDFLDVPGAHKIHAAPVPYGGGLAVAATVTIVVLGAFTALLWPGAHRWLPDDVTPHAAGARTQFGPVGILLACGLAIHILGLIDDRRKLSAGVKFAVELAVGAIFAILVKPLGLFLGGGTFEYVVRVVVTAVWIAAVTNIFNFLDHMDGICAGVAAIASAAFLAVAVQTGQFFLGAMLAVLMGACAGFLIYNVHPAKIFLGDGGSLFIGFMLCALTTIFTFYESGHAYPLYRYFAPLAVLGVPICDAAAVMAIRLREGRPLYVGDRNHLAHRLVAMGMTARGAAYTIYILTLYTAVSAVLLYRVRDTTAAILILAQVGVVFMVMRLLEVTGRGQGGKSAA